MRLFLACVVIAFGWIQNASADIIFTLVQDTPGIINPGDDAVFSVFIRTDGGQITAGVGGIDFWISANDPGGTGSETSGGQFVSGTDPYFDSALAGNPSPYQFPFPTSLQVFSGTADPGLDLGPTNTLLAKITLSTVGAIPGGIYEMSLTNLVALAPDGTDLGTTDQPITISYAIAVPEPASFGLVGLALASAAWRRRAKQLASK